VIAIRRRLVFADPDNLDRVLAHQAADPPMPHIQPQLLQLFCHPGPAIAAKTGAVLILDVRQQTQISAKAARRRSPLIDCFAIDCRATGPTKHKNLDP
jgi:hypothetical protein